MNIIHQTIRKAKKEYYDDGFEEIKEWVSGGFYSNSNIEVLDEDKVLIKNFLSLRPTSKILKGDEYVRQFNTDGGQTWVYRTKKIFYDLLSKYKIFTEY